MLHKYRKPEHVTNRGSLLGYHSTHNNVKNANTVSNKQDIHGNSGDQVQSARFSNALLGLAQRQELAQYASQVYGNQYVQKHVSFSKPSKPNGSNFNRSNGYFPTLLQREPGGMTDGNFPMSVMAPKPEANLFQSNHSMDGMPSSEAPMSAALPFNPSMNLSFTKSIPLGRRVFDFIFAELNADISAHSSGSFAYTSKQRETNPEMSLDVREKKAEIEQEFHAGLNTIGLQWDGTGFKLSFVNKIVPLKISPEGTKIHLSATPPIKSKFAIKNWEFSGNLNFKLTFDFGGQVRPEWIAFAVTVFAGVRYASMIGTMMAESLAQLASSFASVPIFIMPSEHSNPFGSSHNNTIA